MKEVIEGILLSSENESDSNKVSKIHSAYKQAMADILTDSATEMNGRLTAELILEISEILSRLDSYESEQIF